MFDGFLDLFKQGKTIVVASANATEIEKRLRRAKIFFWGWTRFTASDGGDCVGFMVAKKDWKRARKIAGMEDRVKPTRVWEFLEKAIVVAVILGSVVFVLISIGYI